MCIRDQLHLNIHIWTYFFINYKIQPTESAFWDCNCGSNWPTTVSDQMYSAIVHILHASSSVRCSGQWLMKSRKMYHICSKIHVKWYRYIIKEFIHLILFFVVFTCTKQYIKKMWIFFFGYWAVVAIMNHTCN